MNELSAHLKLVQTIFMFFLSFCLVVWALWLDGRPYAAGIMLGACVSLINARHLAWKVQSLSARAIVLHGQQKQVPKAGTGFLVRVAIAGLATLVATRYPEHVAIPALVAGFFFVPVVNAVKHQIQQKTRRPD